MKVDAIALDIDGTLLNDDKQISPRVLNAINACRLAGVRVILCSGRTRLLLPALSRELSFTDEDLVIGFNGAAVYKGSSYERILFEPMSGDDVLTIREYAKSKGFGYHFYENDELHSVDGEAHAATIREAEDYSVPYRIANLDDVKRYRNVGKTVIIDSNNVFDDNEEHIIDALCDYTLVRSIPIYFEISKKGVTKASALAKAADLLGIDMKNVIAIGDEKNDIPMLEVSGVSIAMGNASNEVKELCDYVTLDNNHDGVAVAIERFVLS